MYRMVEVFESQQLLRLIHALILMSGMQETPFMKGLNLISADNELTAGVLKCLRDTRDLCEKLELRTSVVKIDRTISFIESSNDVKKLNIFHECSHVIDAIGNEMQTQKCFILSPHDVQYFDANSLFGGSVEKAFPSAKDDIAEAGRCLALSRTTAAVLHLMRASEIGLRALAHDLNIQVANRTWGLLIADIEKALTTSIAPTLNLSSSKKNAQVKMHQLALPYFRGIKDYWRDDAVHTNRQYSRMEAASAFETCKNLLILLAQSGLKE